MDQLPTAVLEEAGAWWQHAGWYRALTLAERSAAWAGNRASQAEPTTWKRERAERLLQQWKGQAPFQHDSWFAERLAAEGLTEQHLFYLLAESPEALQARLAVPAWVQALRQAWEAQEPAADLPLPALDERTPTAAFLPALRPLLAQGHQRLRQGIDTLSRQHPQLPFDPPAVVSSLFAALCRQLLAQASRILALELKVAAMQWGLAGTTPEGRFDHFVERLSQPEVLLPLLEEYSVLARHLVQIIDHWLDASLEFLTRLCADWQKLRSTFFSEGDPGLLVEVRGDAGDRHRGGRSVLLLKFHSGAQLVYKPKSLALDQHFQELLCWFNDRGAEPQFQTLSVLDCGTYGWSAFVAERECASEEAVQRFYERQGAYLALLYTLEATDLHFENLIAAGEHPMLVDLETLFHPRALTDHILSAGEPAFEALQQSVVRVGLLPQRIWGSDEAKGINISGLGGAEGQLTPRAVPTWQNTGTDQLQLVRTRREIRVSKNRPGLNGQSIDASLYQESILAGFKRMYRLLMNQCEVLLTEVLPRFAQDEIRFVARPTEIYGRFLYDSFRPELLRDALERERHFDRLWVGIQWQPALARLIPAERADLLRGDIPFFTTRPGCCDVFTSQGETISPFFRESSLDAASRRLRQLDEADLARQAWIINASFACLVRDTPHSLTPPSPLPPASLRVTHESLLRGACALGDVLHRTAVHGAGTAGWLGIAQMREREWAIQPAGLDLYNGLPGITLFLAYLSALTGKYRYQTLAEAALENIRTLLHHPQKQEALRSIGAFEGWGGLIYLFAHLGSLWNRPVLFQEAEELVRLLPGLVEEDKGLDIIAGAAGCIASLLSLHAVAPSAYTLEQAIHCGDHLLACAQPMQEGMGWKIPQQEIPLTGFAHGAAGIALSLLRLAAASGAGRFHQAARAAMAYERSLFSPGQQNWPDLRKRAVSSTGEQVQQEEAPAYMVAWCHGAAGIGLARLASLSYVDNTVIHQEIAAALQTTMERGFGGQLSLCHGDAGNLEALVAAHQTLGAPHYQEHAMQRLGALLDDLSARDGQREFPSPIEPLGLMTGIAGIGYELLRLAEPERVPCILTQAPPVSTP